MKATYLSLCISLLFLAWEVDSFGRNRPVSRSGTNKGATNTAQLAANCAPASSSTELDINNVRALIHTGGDLWRDPQNQARYEIPKNSGRTSIFAGALWLGGKDESGQLKIAAQTFRDQGNDFWTGPLNTVTSEIDPATCLEYDRHYLTSRDEIAEFNAWYEAGLADAENGTNTQTENFPNYSPPQILYDWPAHGRNYAPYNEDFYLAPFFDRNENGLYEPEAGDYPGYELNADLDCNRKVENIYGDRNLWWVFNDKGNIHTQSGGRQIGMEIRAQAFAFATNDEVNNMTFYNYELINRSSFTLTDTYFGMWVDADLGFPDDDYVGCDVTRGLGYCYNGRAVDNDGQGALGYGDQPPAIGVDFFQGPFQDPDGIDNQVGIGEDEALNGVGYGDGTVDNERFGMRRFLYYSRGAGITQDPDTDAQYYNYMRGIWKDGNPMTYGGTGYNPTDPNAIQADFMFPADTDPLGWGTGGVPQPSWTEENSGTQPFDRRFIQSAGPFRLAPGAVNNITVGVVWARANSGGPFASVQELRRADDKTQRLFDECFRVFEGPHAPDLTIQELDQELIVYLSNSRTSNNYLNGYSRVDPLLVAPDSVDSDNDGVMDTELTEEEKREFATFRFQGYQLYQVKDASVSPADLDNADLARLVAQVDIKDGVGQLVNYYLDEDIDAEVPVEEVDGNDEGIRHAFRIKDDKFATGDNRLVNHKQYHFMAVAYAYNAHGGDFGNLRHLPSTYDPDDNRLPKGQKTPYIGSRKAALGGITVYSGIPHITSPEANGTILRAQFGDEVELTRVEGSGNGNRWINIKIEDLESVFGPDERVLYPTYEAGAAPVAVKVIDPLNVKPGEYTLRFYDEASVGDLDDARWEITGGDLQSPITSDQAILVENEQLIFDLGLSVTLRKGQDPFEDRESLNGALGAEMIFEDPGRPWLTGVPDAEGFTFQNWILAGRSISTDNPDTQVDESIFSDLQTKVDTTDVFVDENQNYESFLGGTWAPGRLVSANAHGPLMDRFFYPFNDLQYLSSVDIVITKDKSRWTRVPVFEMQEESTLAEGGAKKGYLRAARSVDKFGRPGSDSDSLPSQNPDDPNYISAYGMGWFPGYAVDIETGERLNMAFGEDSWLEAENGRDMLWNPSTTLTDGPFNDIRFGGKHYIYVFRNNVVQDDVDNDMVNPENRMPAYDAGKFIIDEFANAASLPQLRNVYRALNWVGLPLLADGEEFMSNDVRIRLRVTKPFVGYGTGEFLSPGDQLVIGEQYFVDKGPIEHDGESYVRGDYFIATTGSFTVPATVTVGSVQVPNNDIKDNVVASVNSGLPMYNFSTDHLTPEKEVISTAQDALSEIRAVPNPYYGYSEYETSKVDNRIKIINLPVKCTIRIYTLNGTLIRTIDRDDTSITSVDWDLKNHAGIPVASGTYLIHIDAPGIGEKVLKWFGALRPVDLDSF